VASEHFNPDFEELAAVFAEAWAVGDVDQALGLARDASVLSSGWQLPLTTPWPTCDAYSLAVVCPRCSAQPGDECDVRRGGHRFHAPRQDRGSRRARRDRARAPWREDRVPGRRYDSLGDLAELTEDDWS
jgi:hypothetical protein